MSDPFLTVGLVTRAHGVKGELAVRTFSEVEQRFAPGSVLLLGPDGSRALTIASVRGPHGGRLLIRFRGIDDRDAAESLRGQVLLVRVEETPPIEDEDRFWVHQIVGLEVRTDDGRRLGTVREILHNPANDIWVVEGPGGQTLLPAVHELIEDVDLERGRVIVRTFPGLTEEGG